MAEQKNMTLETMKELGRWAVLLVVSWFVTQTLLQVSSVPETYELKLWVFTYALPVRFLFQFGLASLGRLVDRLIHESKSVDLKGLLPF